MSTFFLWVYKALALIAVLPLILGFALILGVALFVGSAVAIVAWLLGGYRS